MTSWERWEEASAQSIFHLHGIIPEGHIATADNQFYSNSRKKDRKGCAEFWYCPRSRDWRAQPSNSNHEYGVAPMLATTHMIIISTCCQKRALERQDMKTYLYRIYFGALKWRNRARLQQPRYFSQMKRRSRPPGPRC